MHFFLNLRWQDLADIILVAIIIYQVVLALRGTQAVQVLAGLFLLFLAYLVARQLEFFTLEWLLDIIVKSFVLIVIILFQADIRRVLSRVGKKALAPGGVQSPVAAEEICAAAETLAGRHIGALVVLERYIGLSEYLEGAIKLDALVTRELLISLFWPHNPTHDGAVIIQGDRAGRRRLPAAPVQKPQPGPHPGHPPPGRGGPLRTDRRRGPGGLRVHRPDLPGPGGQAASGSQPRGSAPAPGGPDGNSRRRKRNLD